MVALWLYFKTCFFDLFYKLEFGTGEKKEDSKDTVEGVYIDIRTGVER